MHISIGSYKHKPEKWNEMVDFGKSIIPELRKIQGFRQITMVKTGEATSATYSIYDSKQDAEAATPQIQAIFARMAEFITAPPIRETYEVAVFETL